MAADLDFCQDLPPIRILKIRSGPRTGDDKTPAVAADINVSTEDDRDGCRTPTADEHKIPRVSECPPAPMKPKRTVACKRKLVELDFFEAANGDEVEGFFRSSFDSAAAVKRSCPCK